MKPNQFKRALAAGQQQVGIWSSLASTLSAEIVAGAGFEWIVLDAEHGPSELREILAQLQAVSAYEAEPMVRIPISDQVLVKKYLDIGARSLLVPFVQTAEEARQAVAFTRYPPDGVRGVSVGTRANQYGRVPDYLKNAHEQICIVVQIETSGSLEALPGILAVEGVDAAFIGPSDLAASLGHLGDAAHAEVQTAIERALEICAQHGKPIGILAPVEADARRYLEAGFSFVAVGSDLGLLARGSENLRARYQDLAPVQESGA
jgi:4-hydroxy-2-oxoheptanedioate aldolase